MRLTLPVFVLALAWACPSPAIAATGPVQPADGPELPLRAAVQAALQQRPELRAFEFQLRRQQAREAAAALRPAPELALEVEDAFGTGAHAGLRSAQTTLSLGQVLELGGKRAGRETVAAGEGAVLRSSRAAQQLDVVAEVARRHLDVLLAQQRLAIAEEGERLAVLANARVQQRVDAARAPPAEASRAAGQLIDARLRSEDSRHELQIARHELAAALGDSEVRFGRAVGDLYELPTVAAYEVLRQRLDANPDLLRFVDEARLRDAELRLARLQARPDLRFTLGARRLEQSDSVALVAGVSLPLFTARHAEPAEARARADRDQVAVDREGVWLRLQARLFSAHGQLEHMRHVATALRNQLLPQLQTALDETAYAYERGRYSYLEWTVAQRDLLAARLRLAETAHDFHELRIEIERLTAESLDVTGDTP
jgi:outer membrane protein, heavy metal efflux system